MKDTLNIVESSPVSHMKELKLHDSIEVLNSEPLSKKLNNKMLSDIEKRKKLRARLHQKIRMLPASDELIEETSPQCYSRNLKENQQSRTFPK